MTCPGAPVSYVSVRNGLVNSTYKSYSPVFGATSICTTTQATWDTLVIGENYASAAQKLGCDGALFSSTSVTPGVSNSTFTWGKVASGPYAQISFKNGILDAKAFRPN
jgi:hypothetical protein